MHLTATNFGKMWPNFAKFSKNSLNTTYFALLKLILAKCPPLWARMYEYNYIFTHALLRFYSDFSPF